MDTTQSLPGHSTHVDVGGVTLHVRQAGPDDGDPLVLLHGFPEFWYGWHRQMAPLADAGYRVIVPDGRGYNRSDKPSGVDAYRIDRLARDVTGLLDAEGHESARVVGHDWGAMVAWWLALDHPDRVDRLGVLNVPHPWVFGRTLRSNPRQLARSWYAGAFQLPWLPERLLGASDAAALERALTDSAAPETFSEADLDRYHEAWAREGALTGMLNWYRAAGRSPRLLLRDDRVTVPTLVLWGEADVALVPEMARRSVRMCDDGELETFPHASHWLQHEEPDAVTERLRGFL